MIRTQLGITNGWMLLLGKVPDVTADLIRKAFYPADEHVANAAAASPTDRRFLCYWDQGGGVT